jgi:hypothetical protein
MRQKVKFFVPTIAAVATAFAIKISIIKPTKNKSL